MGYLLAQFWLWLALALVIGLVIGWFTQRASSIAFWRGLLPWGLVLGIGGLASAFRVLPGAPGFWLDLGMLMVASYFIGCLTGHLLRAPQQEERQGEATPFAKLAEAASVAAPPVASAAPLQKEVAVEPAASGAAAVMPDAPEEAITGLSAPRGGKADDLTRIDGIDAQTAARLNSLGLYHFDQIAALTPGQQRWLLARLGLAGRFPGWWWRWRHDAGAIIAGQNQAAPKAASSTHEAAHEGKKTGGFQRCSRRAG